MQLSALSDNNLLYSAAGQHCEYTLLAGLSGSCRGHSNYRLQTTKPTCVLVSKNATKDLAALSGATVGSHAHLGRMLRFLGMLGTARAAAERIMATRIACKSFATILLLKDMTSAAS